MATVPHQAPVTAGSKWRSRLRIPEMWTSLAISVMWLVVLFDALFGPDIVASNAGTNYTRVPSAIVIAFFVYLATRVVAKYGFTRGDEER